MDIRVLLVEDDGNIRDIAGKFLLYTLLFLSAAIAVFTFFYARQLAIAFSLYERRQLSLDVQRLITSLEQKTPAPPLGRNRPAGRQRTRDVRPAQNDHRQA